jgi:hypothetical protein
MAGHDVLLEVVFYTPSGTGSDLARLLCGALAQLFRWIPFRPTDPNVDAIQQQPTAPPEIPVEDGDDGQFQRHRTQIPFQWFGRPPLALAPVAPGPGFDPGTVLGTTIFHDPTTLPASGNIATLIDSSTPVINFNQTTPSFQGIAGTGELVGVSHNIHGGVDDYYTAGDVAGLEGSALTIVMLAKQPILTTSDAMISKWRFQDRGGFVLQTSNAFLGELLFGVASIPTDPGSNAVVTTDANITNAFHVITTQFLSGSVTFEIDDVIPSTSVTGIIPTTLLNSDADLEIGRWDGIGRYFSGYIGNGLWVGPVIPSSTDLQGIQDFFAAFIP